MRTFRLVKAARTQGCGVKMWFRDEEGKHLVEDEIRPYFYVPEDEAADTPLIVDGEFGFTSIFGEPVRKVYTANPSDVPLAREKFTRHYEADIPYARRYLIDKRIRAYVDGDLKEVAPEPILLIKASLDIETYQTAQGKPPAPATDPITCIGVGCGDEYVSLILDDYSIVLQDGKWAVLHFDDEKKMLRAFLELLAIGEFDVVMLWNADFDMDYLEARCKFHGLQQAFRAAILPTCYVDLLGLYRKLYRRRSYRLKDIALEEGFTDKLEEQVHYGKLWKEDKEGLLARNKRHVTWVQQIDDKRQIIDYFLAIKEYAGMEDLKDIGFNSVIIDTLALRRATGVLPSKDKHEHETFEGAVVMKPEAGVVKSVCVFDMSMFYPTALLNNLLDPIIYREYKKTAAEGWDGYKPFAQKWLDEGKPTILIGMAQELVKERNRLKKIPEYKDKYMAIKGVLNSLYGVFAAPSFRLYTPEIPARITEITRVIITQVKQAVESWNLKVLAMDTDSVFIALEKDRAKEIEEKINSYLSTIGDFSIKLEHYFVTLIFTGVKKRYVGLHEDGSLLVTGFEIKRTDASNYTKEIQEKIIRMILEGREGEIIPYLRDRVNGIKTAKLEDLIITKTLSKDLEEYEKATQSYFKLLKEQKSTVGRGDFIRLLPVKGAKYGVMVFQDMGEVKPDVKVDWEEIIEKQIKLKVEDLLPLVGMNWSQIAGQERLL